MKNFIELTNFRGELCCPITGKMILSPDLCEGPSPATVFIVTDMDDEFSYASPGFEEAYNEIRVKTKNDYDIEGLLKKTMKKLKMEEIVVFVIHYCGTDSCGHHSFSSYIGIDFSKPLN